MKRNLLFAFWLLAGIITGGLIASVCQNVPFLSWLAYSASIGIGNATPFVLDLSILTLTFAFALRISVAQIFTIFASIFLYRWTVKKYEPDCPRIRLSAQAGASKAACAPFSGLPVQRREIPAEKPPPAGSGDGAGRP